MENSDRISRLVLAQALNDNLSSPALAIILSELLGLTFDRFLGIFYGLVVWVASLGRLQPATDRTSDGSSSAVQDYPKHLQHRRGVLHHEAYFSTQSS